MATIRDLGDEFWDELSAKYGQKVGFAVVLSDEDTKLRIMWPPGETRPDTHEICNDFNDFVFDRPEYHDYCISDEYEIPVKNPVQKVIVIEKFKVGEMYVKSKTGMRKTS